MDRHLKVLGKAKGKLLNLPNVVGVGVGIKKVGEEPTGRLSLVVFVEKKVPARQLRKDQAVPLKIDDLETDVIETGKFRFLSDPLAERIRRVRPASPGVSIGHFRVSAGTFGAVVKDKNTKEKLILSNNHILANATNGRDGRSAVGDPVYQPGPHDGGGPRDRIGSLLRFMPVRRGAQEAECPVAAAAARTGNVLLHALRPNYDLRLTKRTQENNLIDAAVARPDSPNAIVDDILDVGPVQGVGQIHPSDQVLKSGRTSGVTEGKVLSIGVTVKVDIVEDEISWFADQIMTDLVSKPGDSGSLILNDKKEAVGLLFAGSDKYTVFNRIQNVLEKLNLIF